MYKEGQNIMHNDYIYIQVLHQPYTFRYYKILSSGMILFLGFDWSLSIMITQPNYSHSILKYKNKMKVHRGYGRRGGLINEANYQYISQ